MVLDAFRHENGRQARAIAAATLLADWGPARDRRSDEIVKSVRHETHMDWNQPLMAIIGILAPRRWFASPKLRQGEVWLANATYVVG